MGPFLFPSSPTPAVTHLEWMRNPEWWLFIVTTLTLFAIIYQSREMARATKAMRDATQLQEVGLRQWVTLSDWKCHADEGNVFRLNISYKIINSTKIPLDLDFVSTSMGGGERQDHGAVSWLVPDNPYTADITKILTTDERKQFETSSLVVPLECSIFYRDALGKQWEQTFTRILVCRRNYVYVHEERNRVRDSTPAHKQPA
jgi:hypothetical protein